MRFITGILAFLIAGSSLSGQKIPEPMVPKRLVNDFTGLLTSQQQIDLNNKLLEFNNRTSTQIYTVIYDDLQDYPVNEFAYQLAEKWGIGQKGKNNGILVLVSPANHKLTIQTGYGLEGAVPDAIAKRLIEQVISPAFKAGKYYAGLDSATNVLMALTQGEFTADNYLKKSGQQSKPAVFFIVLIVIFLLLSGIFRNRRSRFYHPARSLPWWLLLGAGTSSRSGWGSFSSGGGSFGGGGGGFGGFGGGGGGSFGGGGASGGW